MIVLFERLTMKLFILEYTHLSFIVKEIRIFILLLESNFKSRKIFVCEEALEFWVL